MAGIYKKWVSAIAIDAYYYCYFYFKLFLCLVLNQSIFFFFLIIHDFKSTSHIICESLN